NPLKVIDDAVDDTVALREPSPAGRAWITRGATGAAASAMLVELHSPAAPSMLTIQLVPEALSAQLPSREVINSKRTSALRRTASARASCSPSFRPSD